MENNQKSKRTNVFGIIAASIGVIAIFTPRIFLTPVLIGLIIFTILGLAKDRHKIYSLLGLAIGALILFFEFKDSADSVKIYSVEYSVECVECDCSYTNVTGGTDNIETIRGTWSKKISAQGDEFLYLSAQNGQVSNSITATIKVNGKIVDTETSNGRFAIASASCNPKDVNN